MALISEKDREFLTDYFAKQLKDPVQITYFTQHDSQLAAPSQECMYCKDTREILEEVAGLSDKIELKVYDFVADAQEAERLGVDRIPATVISGNAKGKVRFFGIPSGYEFSSLVEVIADISRGETNLSDVTKAELAKVTEDVHIQVFVTPT
ncbi:MAG TPA: thioredoxin family protein [Chloroflexota bacterium]|nr:thioredoxin family protein [Chloroflexota bacterium]